MGAEEPLFLRNVSLLRASCLAENKAGLLHSAPGTKAQVRKRHRSEGVCEEESMRGLGKLRGSGL